MDHVTGLSYIRPADLVGALSAIIAALEEVAGSRSVSRMTDKSEHGLSERPRA